MLSDDQITQIRERLQQGANVLELNGYHGIAVTMRKADALVDQLRQERDAAQGALREAMGELTQVCEILRAKEQPAIDAAREVMLALDLAETLRAKAEEALAEAAHEINCAGPVAHRIRVLKQTHAKDLEACARLRTALEAHLKLAHFNDTLTSFCWFCSADVNGTTGSPQPHEPDCIGVKSQAALALPDASGGQRITEEEQER